MINTHLVQAFGPGAHRRRSHAPIGHHSAEPSLSRVHVAMIMSLPAQSAGRQPRRPPDQQRSLFSGSRPRGLQVLVVDSSDHHQHLSTEVTDVGNVVDQEMALAGILEGVGGRPFEFVPISTRGTAPAPRSWCPNGSGGHQGVGREHLVASDGDGRAVSMRPSHRPTGDLGTPRRAGAADRRADSARRCWHRR